MYAAMTEETALRSARVNVMLWFAAAAVVSMIYTSCTGAKQTAEDEIPLNLRQGLEAHYRFDAVENGVVPDLSGAGRHGRLEGAAVVEDPVRGMVASFDGEGAVIELPELRLEAMSFAAWAKVDPEVEVAVESGPSGVRRRRMFLIDGGTDEDGRKRYRSFHGTWSGSIGLGVDAPESSERYWRWQPGDWTHVAATFDGVRLRLYIDGELAKRTRVEHDVTEMAGPAWLGGDDRFDGNGYNFWQGRMDEVAIFSRAISHAEVRQLIDPEPLARDVYAALHLLDGDRAEEARELIKQLLEGDEEQSRLASGALTEGFEHYWPALAEARHLHADCLLKRQHLARVFFKAPISMEDHALLIEDPLFDPAYLIELLETLPEAEREPVVHQLVRITEQDHGSDTDAWYEWFTRE